MSKVGHWTYSSTQNNMTLDTCATLFLICSLNFKPDKLLSAFICWVKTWRLVCAVCLLLYSTKRCCCFFLTCVHGYSGAIKLWQLWKCSEELWMSVCCSFYLPKPAWTSMCLFSEIKKTVIPVASSLSSILPPGAALLQCCCLQTVYGAFLRCCVWRIRQENQKKRLLRPLAEWVWSFVDCKQVDSWLKKPVYILILVKLNSFYSYRLQYINCKGLNYDVGLCHRILSFPCLESAFLQNSLFVPSFAHG